MTDPAPVVTRFAPSPTGFLHIGGARTALFNWLYARGRGGQFRLRIEDTDRERSTDRAVEAIVEGLRWLGLDWDGEPVSQHARADAHRAAAHALLNAGRAYKCFVPADALAAKRAAAQETLDRARALRKQAKALADDDAGDRAAMLAQADALAQEANAGLAAFRSPWRDRDPAEAPKDAPFVVRFKGPLDGETSVPDAVQGDVRFAHKDLDDLVLLRADGSPTYNLAVVVDDHDMGVTHVIRGDDHLVNAGRQTLIYNALGWTPPVFAHIPLIHGPDGKKLSKRHGALGAEAYRALGHLPEGMRNYLLRLGFSHGDQEIFTTAEALTAFDLSGINKAPARLDFDKLAHVNGHHLAAADNDRVFALAVALAEWTQGRVLGGEALARLRSATPHVKTRARTLVEVMDQAAFALAARPIALNAKAAKALAGEETRARLTRLRDRLSAVTDWTEDALHDALQHAAESETVSFGKIGAPLRAALTGGAPAPDMHLVLAILGREEVLHRLDDVLRRDPVATPA